MKLCRSLPGIEVHLQSGSLSLSAASQLQVFFEKRDKKVKEEARKKVCLSSLEKEEFKGKDISEEKALKGDISQEEKESLVKKAKGCFTRDVEKLLSEVEPSLSISKRDRVRFLGKGKVEIKVVIEEKHYKELEELKALLSHRNPALSYGELLSILSEEALRKHDPRKRNIRKGKVQTQGQEIKGFSTEFKATSAPGPKHNIKQNNSTLGLKHSFKHSTSTPPKVTSKGMICTRECFKENKTLPSRDTLKHF